MSWNDYHQFDKDTRFSEKAGFQLTDKQVELVHELVRWAKTLNKAEVGCGKTVMATVASMMLDFQVTVITLPPILLDAWYEWLSRFGQPVVYYYGTPKHRAKLREKEFPNARWIICTYDGFRRDFKHLLPLLSTKKWYEIVVDEAHWMKNPDSVLFSKVVQASAGNVGIQMLTGTPISRPTDAFAYIKIKSPKLYKDYPEFEAIHVKRRNEYKVPIEYAHLDKLSAALNLQSVSTTKEEAHGYTLKPLTPPCLYTLDDEHQDLYVRLVDEQLLEYEDKVIDASTPQKLRQALQQVIVHFDYFSNDPSKRSRAYDWIDQTLNEVEVDKPNRSKLIIWTKYKMTSRKVTQYINDMGIRTVAAYSEVDSKASVAEFMSDPKCRVLVAQYQSAGAGLNPQHVCWEALFMEYDAVPIYIRQAWGRIDRVGQKHLPRMQFLRARNTVQMGLYENLLANDDLVYQIEPSKQSLRAVLLGEAPLAELAKRFPRQKMQSR